MKSSTTPFPPTSLPTNGSGKSQEEPESGFHSISTCELPCNVCPADASSEHALESEELERYGLLSEITRRRFVQVSTAAASSLALGGTAAISQDLHAVQAGAVTLKVNGKSQTIRLDPRTSLLDALREHLDMTGTKKGCDHGQCGACTVLLDGRRVNSCLTLAYAAEGAEITTIEGLGKTDEPKTIEDLSAVQAAFLTHDGYQCGYCTPGQILSATAAIAEHTKGELSIVSWQDGKTDKPEFSDDEIRERMSGNICRCGAYPNIVAAVRAAAKGANA